MRALANSVLATLFVLALLLVLPLVAVFGIPEFVPVVASSSTDREAAHRRPAPVAGVGESAAGGQTDDLFADFDRVDATGFDTRDALHRPEPEQARDLPLDGWEFDDRGHAARTASDRRFAEGDTVGIPGLGTDTPGTEAAPRSVPDRPPADRLPPDGGYRRPRTTTNAELTWRDAVQRLRELGIDEYNLSPGRGDHFHFACNYAPPDNPRVVHRFEAEAEQPLDAVRRVLGQIDAWTNRRP